MVGNRTRVKIVKNKVAPPFRQSEFDIRYGEGISREGDLIDLAVRERVIEKSGAWYSFDGEQVGQGRERTRRTLLEDEPMRAEVESRVRKALDLPGGEEDAPEA